MITSVSTDRFVDFGYTLQTLLVSEVKSPSGIVHPLSYELYTRPGLTTVQSIDIDLSTSSA